MLGFRHILVAACALLAASCAQRAELPAPPGAGPVPPPPSINRPPPLAPVESAGPLGPNGVGRYMDRVEADTRARLRGLGVMVTRPGDTVLIIVPNTALFDGRALSDGGRALLGQLALVLRRYDRSAVAVNGYTDTTGTPDANLAVSQRRAGLVAEMLASQGVPRGRLTAEGFGATSLRIPTPPDRAEPRNRRIEIKIVARPG